MNTKCKEVEKKMILLTEDRLTDTEILEIEDHINICRDCRIKSYDIVPLLWIREEFEKAFFNNNKGTIH